MKTIVLIIGLSTLLLTGCFYGPHGHWDRYDRYDRDNYSSWDRDHRRYDRDHRYDRRHHDYRRNRSWGNRESR